jgi:phytoene/squalene synthetase
LQQANRALQNIYLLAKLYDLDRIVAFGRALGVVEVLRDLSEHYGRSTFVLGVLARLGRFVW